MTPARRRRAAAPLAGVLLALAPLTGAAAAPADDAVAVCRITDPDIVEASGLVATGSPPAGLLVTANDSGDEGRFFVLDAGSCATVGETRWEEDPEDVEALAPAVAGDGQQGVWVGDLGDNPGNRDTVRIALLPVAPGDREADPQWTDLRYPDGPRDAEALLRDPRTGRLFVVSKRVVGAAVYAVPDRVAPGAVGELRRVAAAPSLVTDGAFWPDGRHVLLRDYGRASVLSWPGLETVGSFPLPDQPGGEALAVTRDGRVLVASEGRDEPVLEAPVPADVRAVLEGDAPASPDPTPDQRGSVPGQQAGPSASDGASDVAWRGILVALGGCALLGLVLRVIFRDPSR